MTMLKEILIVILAFDFIFLLVPLFGLYPFWGFAEFILTLGLVATLLVYSAFDIKRLLSNKKRKTALSFGTMLIITIILSYYLVLFQIMPIIAPKLLV